MFYYGIILLILPIFIGNKLVEAQSAPLFDLQEFLNIYCSEHDSTGCKTDGMHDPNVAVANPASKCSSNEKICPQIQSKCVPNETNCNKIGKGIKCRIPDGYGVVTQVLSCGDGTPTGTRCGNGKEVPFLTVVLVQCGRDNTVVQRPVSSLGVLAGPGDDGGAGVYECSEDRSWNPQSESPVLSHLTLSCRDTDCGKVPHPDKYMPVHRRWAWVRAIYKNRELHCTATLVSSTAVVTAAHCLWSGESNQQEIDLQQFQLEIPGPIENTPRIKIQPKRIYIHPQYDPTNLNHDLAVLFFKNSGNNYLPTVCITSRPHTLTSGKKQVVASLQGPDENEAPLWKFSEASWDRSCITVTDRHNNECTDVLKVEPSQFCAKHEDVSIKPGSSGGPYLAEVGEDLKEVWVLMGVLSKFSNISSCMKDHSIYGQVADDSRWIRDCVFDERCT